jgi:hypothetical protein
MSARADPSDCLGAIAYSRALRFSLGQLDWHDAVDGAWAASVKLGIETDAAQAILAEAFRPLRPDLDAMEVFIHATDPTEDEYEGLSSTFARLCAEADAKVDQQAINERARAFHEDIPLISRDGVPSAETLQRYYERNLAKAREQRGPAVTTLRAAEYFIKQNDPERLRTWLAGRDAREIKAIQRHLEKEGRPNDAAIARDGSHIRGGEAQGERGRWGPAAARVCRSRAQSDPRAEVGGARPHPRRQRHAVER